MTDRNPLSGIIPGDPVGTVRNTLGEATDAVKDLVDRRGGQEHAPLPTVEKVDPERYAGRWYELARLPMRFQKDETVSIAEYAVHVDGTIGVYNVAYLGSEVDAAISGTATAAKGAESTYARLQVRFGGIAGLFPPPAEGNYWILAITEDYSMALVGTPDRRSLWLLGRDQQTGVTAQARDYLALAGVYGFNVSDLLYADWNTGRTSDQPPV